ncbi:MAG: D-glycero-alpha-D-manno-heptose-1,7-bisphosphate 7-phosphatase [Candidatus Hodarchaeales archaeon]|jgi:D-glycero-D-manno-heptose 1,7-bisphosphate phosphatase
MDKKKAVILDRDGTIIEDKNYAYKIEDFELLDGVIEGLKLLQKDYLFFIVTNQSGIGRGYYSLQDFQNFNNHLIHVLKEQNIEIVKTYFCLHVKDDNCDCRKPKTKFIDEIIKEFNVDITKSWMIGDHPSDIQFGINAGCRTIFLTTGHGHKHIDDLKSLRIKPTIIRESFLEAVEDIIEFL